MVLVDNGSDPPERAALELLAYRRGYEIEISAENLGYSGGCNIGIRRALALGADAVLVMNNDVLVETGAVRVMTEVLREEADIGAVAPSVFEYERPDVALHVECSFDPITGQTRWLRRGSARASLGSALIDTDYISGEAFLTRATVLTDCGLFLERLVSYYEDVEWSLRLRAKGHRLAVAPAAVVTHMVGASGESVRGSYLRARNRTIVVRILGHRSRARVAAWTFPGVLFVAASLVRHRRIRAAWAGPLRGWFDGLWAPV